MKVLVLISAVVISGFHPSIAPAHGLTFSPPLSKRSLGERAKGQRLLIAHDRRVLRRTNYLRGLPRILLDLFPRDVRERRFHAAQLQWTTRQLRKTEAALRGGGSIAHRPLWLCLHRHEATDWHNMDTGSNGHYGGLQMTMNWLGIVRGNPASLSPSEQMRAAERGYRESGYSIAWLWGQWGQTLPYCTAYI